MVVGIILLFKFIFYCLPLGGTDFRFNGYYLKFIIPLKALCNVWVILHLCICFVCIGIFVFVFVYLCLNLRPLLQVYCPVESSVQWSCLFSAARPVSRKWINLFAILRQTTKFQKTFWKLWDEVPNLHCQQK